MISGYFQPDTGDGGYPYINMDVEFHAPLDVRLEIPFVVDTGAERTLLSPLVAQHLYDRFDFNIRSLQSGNPIGGVGGLVNTRHIMATLSMGTYRTTMPVPIIDEIPGPNTAPSLLGRDIIYDLALFLERRTHRVLLLDDNEADALFDITGSTL